MLMLGDLGNGDPQGRSTYDVHGDEVEESGLMPLL
jgi:hypothetical protein